MVKRAPKRTTKRVIFQPEAYLGIQRGINQIADLVRPTMGPHHRVVAVDRIDKGKKPEILDSGAIIARRIIQIPDGNEDMGAMFLRHVLWSLNEEVGDGTVTAAVMFQVIYNEGIRFITAGGNAMLLRTYLDKGMRVIINELSTRTIPIRGKQNLSQLAETICYDSELAKLLGEIFDIIVEYGWLEVRKGSGKGLEREYTEGLYWEGGLITRELATTDHGLRAQLENPAILISDLEIEDPRELVPVLELVVMAKIPSLGIIIQSISERALGLLLMKQNREKMPLLAVKVPEVASDRRTGVLDDLGILTGGRTVVKAAGDTLSGVKLNDLGHARRMWADRNYFGIIGGKGNARQLRSHIAGLRTAFSAINETESRQYLQKRIGKLMGGASTLWVGGATPLDIERRKELAERTANAMRNAMHGGALPGGGVAFLSCYQTLSECMHRSKSDEEYTAYKILLRAIEEPFRTLMFNSGFPSGQIMAMIEQARDNHGLDVRTGEVVDMMEAGIFDAAPVLKSAVYSAVSSAGLALTTDVLVHRRIKPEALNT